VSKRKENLSENLARRGRNAILKEKRKKILEDKENEGNIEEDLSLLDTCLICKKHVCTFSEMGHFRLLVHLFLNVVQVQYFKNLYEI
jgi:hypothetical protein